LHQTKAAKIITISIAEFAIISILIDIVFSPEFFLKIKVREEIMPVSINKILKAFP
jgi:hypothetical protein